jgi:hypothetical protein
MTRMSHCRRTPSLADWKSLAIEVERFIASITVYFNHVAIARSLSVVTVRSVNRPCMGLAIEIGYANDLGPGRRHVAPGATARSRSNDHKAVDDSTF